VEDGDLSTLRARGWYVSGSWILTGESKSAGPDQPKRPLFGGGIGAFELAARIEDLRFWSDGEDVPSTSPRGDTVIPHRDRAMTFGVNWFPNRWIKIQANAIREDIVDPSHDSGTGIVWSRVLRFQLSL
jgi:phosphate-selective porin OprO and OprP